MKRNSKLKSAKVKKTMRDSFRFIWLAEMSAGTAHGVGYGKDGFIYYVSEQPVVGFASKKITVAESIGKVAELNKSGCDGATWDEESFTRWLMQIKKGFQETFLGIN